MYVSMSFQIYVPGVGGLVRSCVVLPCAVVGCVAGDCAVVGVAVVGVSALRRGAVHLFHNHFTSIGGT